MTITILIHFKVFLFAAVFWHHDVFPLQPETKTKSFMEKINFSDGVIAQMMESEAWKALSEDLNWNESQLEKYADKLDWENVSTNNNIFWTASMIEKFKNRINWRGLSESIDLKSVSADLLEKYSDRWDWSSISNNTLTLPIIDRFADRLDWSKIIDNWSIIDEISSEEFVKKYQDKIPASRFHNSRLWDKLVEKKQWEIRSKVCMD